MSDSESIASSSAWSEHSAPAGGAPASAGSANVRVKFALCQDGSFKVAGRNEGTKLQPGDTLTHVAGSPVEGMSAEELRRLLRGPPKSLVEVRLMRGWAQLPIRAQLLRRSGRRAARSRSPLPDAPAFRDMPAPEPLAAGAAGAVPDGLGALPPPPIPSLGALPPAPAAAAGLGPRAGGATARAASPAASPPPDPPFRALPAPSPDASVTSSVSAASAPAAFRGGGAPGHAPRAADGAPGRALPSPAPSSRAAVTPEGSVASSAGGGATPATDAALVRRLTRQIERLDAAARRGEDEVRRLRAEADGRSPRPPRRPSSSVRAPLSAACPISTG
jgi:hypothetical protein